MSAKDLVYKLNEKSMHGKELWGILPYFCPSCGHLNEGGYVTQVTENGTCGAYGSFNSAVGAARMIFRDPVCFSCMYKWAKKRAKEILDERSAVSNVRRKRSKRRKSV